MRAAAKPRLLYLLAATPYPVVSGNRQRTATLIAALSSDFDVRVLAADDEASPSPAWSAAAARHNRRRWSRRALATDTFVAMARGEHVLLVRSIRAGLARVFREELAASRPAVVVLGRPMIGPYIDIAHDAGAVVIVDADESMAAVAWELVRTDTAPLAKRARALVEAMFVLGRMERASYPQADQLWVSSEVERLALSMIAATDRIVVIPNSVDVPDEPPPVVDVRAVSFLGWYRYPPNEAAALELMRSVMPAIRAAGGPQELVLIGAEPTPLMIQTADGLHGVSITGEVDDVIPFLRSAGVLVLPIRAGGGTRVKILEAAAAGVPVVSTRLGIEGIEMKPGVHVLTAETTDDFAARVRQLADDPMLRSGLVGASFELVRRKHSLEAVGRAVRSALAKLVAPGPDACLSPPVLLAHRQGQRADAPPDRSRSVGTPGHD